jgi:drug/metabolite transporter (DMT)-like permease
MIFLVLLIVFFALFNLSFRAAQRHGVDLLPTGIVLFGTSALLYLALYLLHPAPLEMRTIGLAVAAGVLFQLMYLLMIPAMTDRGVSVMTALQQLSVLIPITISLAIFHEQPGLLKGLGALLCLVAMPLLSLDKGVSGEGVTSRKLAMYLGLTVVNGVALTASKIFHEWRVPEQLDAYMMVLTGTAALCGVPAALLRGRAGGEGPRLGFDGSAVAWGVYLGLALALGQLFMLLTLRHYEGAVAYPLSQAANVSLVTVVSGVLWRELPGRLGMTGIALAIVAVVLVNL